MLVLKRRRGEQLLIGGNLTLTVLDIQPTRVTLGLDGPREVEVLRVELINRKDNDVPH